MDIALRRPMTLDEFLAWEQRQELRHEFDGFQPVAMTEIYADIAFPTEADDTPS